jgi:hypothetical protein
VSNNAKPQPAEATAYLQVRLVRPSTYSPSEARVMAATQRKPDSPQPGCIVVKVKLRIPVEGWDPFEPEAVIDVPADLVQHPILVEAEDAEL